MPKLRASFWSRKKPNQYIKDYFRKLNKLGTMIIMATDNEPNKYFSDYQPTKSLSLNFSTQLSPQMSLCYTSDTFQVITSLARGNR